MFMIAQFLLEWLNIEFKSTALDFSYYLIYYFFFSVAMTILSKVEAIYFPVKSGINNLI